MEKDGRATLSQLSDATGLSISAVQSRVQKLERRNVILGYIHSGFHIKISKRCVWIIIEIYFCNRSAANPFDDADPKAEEAEAPVADASTPTITTSDSNVPQPVMVIRCLLRLPSAVVL